MTREPSPNHDLSDRLHALAEDAAAQAVPPPAASVRRRGTQRRRRRHAAIAAVALACLLVIGGITATTLLPARRADGPPSFAGTPASTPATSLTTDNLPSASQIKWNEAVVFRIGDTWTDDRDFRPSACMQAKLDTLGAIGLLNRTYPAKNSDNLTASVQVLECGTEQEARTAESTIRSWAEGCADLAGPLHPGAETTDIHPVDTDDGQGYFTELMYPAKGDLTSFDSLGWYRTGRRLAVVTFTSTMIDHNYDLKPGGPVGVLHEMIQTLPAVADRLAR